MADSREIVQSITTALAVAGRLQDDELSELAITYSQLCRDANERLQRCAEYLRRGLRCEAIHLAECQPSLLESAATLQTVEQKDWEQLCAERGVSVAPRLMSDVIPELKEAIARKADMELLHAHHRILALAKAPVSERLSILRAIRERDPNNPCWSGELEQLEKTRVRELRTEAMNASAARDLEQIGRLSREVLGNQWQIAIPVDLVEGLKEVEDALRKESAMKELNDLLPELLSKFEARSAQPCQSLLDRWQELIVQNQISLPLDMQQKVSVI